MGGFTSRTFASLTTLYHTVSGYHFSSSWTYIGLQDVMCTHLSSPFAFGAATSICSMRFAALGSEAELQPPRGENQKRLKISGSTGMEENLEG